MTHLMSYTKELWDEITAHFAPILVERHFAKNALIHRAGSVCPELFLVKEGILRAYYYKEDRDITAHFAFRHEAVSAPDSFILGQASKYHLEALADSQVWAVDARALERYLDAHPHLERLARRFTQAVYLEMLERLEGIVFLTASERYEQLLARTPDLLLGVNLGHVASYLGITQETLSRIRAKQR